MDPCGWIRNELEAECHKQLGVMIKIWLNKILCEENLTVQFKTYKTKLCYQG